MEVHVCYCMSVISSFLPEQYSTVGTYYDGFSHHLVDNLILFLSYLLQRKLYKLLRGYQLKCVSLRVGFWVDLTLEEFSKTTATCICLWQSEEICSSLQFICSFCIIALYLIIRLYEFLIKCGNKYLSYISVFYYSICLPFPLVSFEECKFCLFVFAFSMR